MKERGMIFNSEMVRAILEGRKTQTRRMIKGVDGAASFNPEWDINGEEIFVVLGEKDHTGMNPVLGAISCPFGAVGDRIWVREAFQGPLVSEELLEEYRAYPEKFENPEYCEYAADGGPRPEYCDLDDNLRHGWRPSIHMPRWASRIMLEITGVRVEKLDKISEEDAISEGMQDVICPSCKDDPDYSTTQYDPDTLAAVDEIPCQSCESNRSKFFALWDSICGEGNHCMGDWVWVIEFKRISSGDD